MANFLEDLLSQKGTQIDHGSLIREQKFNVALRDSTCKYLKEKYETNQWDSDCYLVNYLDNKSLNFKWNINKNLFALIGNKILSEDKPFKHDHRRYGHFMRLSSIIHPILSIMIESLFQSQHPNDRIEQESIKSVIAESTILDDVIVKRFFQFYITYKDTSDKIQQIRYKNFSSVMDAEERISVTKVVNKDLEMVVWVGKHIIIYKYRKNWYILPKVYNLLIMNKTADIISVSIYAKLACHFIHGISQYDLYVRFLKEWFILANDYSDNFFTIAKCLESIVTGENLIEVDGTENRSFLVNIHMSLGEETGFYYFSSNLQKILTSANIGFRYELGCLSKICGHPFVNIKKGVEKIVSRAREERVIDPTAIMESVYYSKKLLISRYIQRFSKWPKVTFKTGVHPRLIEAERRGVDPNAPELTNFGALQISDYDLVKLEKNAQFEIFDDFIPYLKDKTISMLKSKVIRAADGDVPSGKDYHRETRLLMKYLTTSGMRDRHKEFLEQYKIASEEDWELIQDYCVIRIVPKEKELKTEFRGFGCQTYENRARCIIAETNASYVLETLMPEQAMTPSELDISKKLLAMRNIGRSYKGHTAIYFSIDASSWCSRFRHLPVKAVAQTLDDYYGENLYGSTMEYYENTLFYVSDVDGTYMWEGQYGGIEGLNQYTWVFVYICQIHTSMDRLGYPYHIMCKGDDLRVVVLIPNEKLREKNINDHKKDIMTLLTKTCNKLGHEIKMEDSYASFNYLSFSKCASVYGMELTQGFRKIQKTYGANNAVLQTLDSSIGAAFSNAHSTARYTLSPYPCYVLALFWASFYLLSDNKYRALSEAKLSALLMTPSLVGGFPVIYLHNMLVRTESDLLAPFLEYIEVADKLYPSIATECKKFLSIHLPAAISYAGLCRDAYALVIPDKPNRPETFLRNLLTRHIRRITKSDELKELFSVTLGGEYEQFLNIIASVNILYPRVIAYIYSKSPWGLIEQLTRKFESGQSIIKALCGGNMYNRRGRALLARAYKEDIRLQRWRISKLEYSANLDELTYSHWYSLGACSTERADGIRKSVWRKPVLGVTMPCMSHLISVMKKPDFASRYQQYNHFNLHYQLAKDIPPLLLNLGWNYCPGSKKPVIGSVTSSGNLMASKRMEETNLVTHKAASLLDLIPWVNTAGSNAVKLIEKLLMFYTNVTPSSLSVYAKTKRSGTLAHHQVGGGFDPRISQNCVSNNLTKFEGESSAHVSLSGATSKKFYINYIQIMCHSIDLIIMAYHFDLNYNISDSYWIVTAPCNYCMREIVEPPMEFSDHELELFKPNILEELKIIKTAHELLKHHSSDPTTRRVIIQYINEDLLMKDAVNGYVQYLLNKTVTHVSRLIDANGDRPLNKIDISDILVLNTTQRDEIKISLTDLKRIDMRHLRDSLRDYVLDWRLRKKPGLSNESFNALIAAVENVNIFPWTPLLESMNQARVLPKFAELLSRMTKYKVIAQGHTVDVISKHVAILLSDLDPENSQLGDLTFIYMTNLNSSEVLKHLIIKWNRLVTFSLLHRLSHSEFNQYFKKQHWERRTIFHEGIKPMSLAGYLENIGIDLILRFGDFLISEGSLMDLIIENKGVLSLSLNVMGPLFSKFIESLEDVPAENNRLAYDRWSTENNKVLPFNVDVFWEDEDLIESMLHFLYCTMPTTVRMVVADLSKCILTVRGQYLPIDIESVDAEAVERTYEKTGLNFHIKRDDKRVRSLSHKTYSDQNEPLQLRNFPTTIEFPRPYNIPGSERKYLGLNTSSQSQWSELYLAMGLGNKFNASDLNCLALADGYGGSTQLMISKIINSNIEYITHQKSADIRTIINESIRIEAHNRRITISEDIANSDMHDITEPLTKSTIKVKWPSVDWMQCDATYSDDNSDNPIKVLESLAELFRDVVSDKGVLISRIICEMFMSSRGMVALSSILAYSSSCLLFFAKSSTRPNEAYLIAQRSELSNIYDRHGSINQKEYDSIMSKFERRVRRAQRILNGEILRYEITQLHQLYIPEGVQCCVPTLLSEQGIVCVGKISNDYIKGVLDALKFEVINTRERDPLREYQRFTLKDQSYAMHKILLLSGYLYGINIKMYDEENIIKSYIETLKEVLSPPVIQRLNNLVTWNEKLGTYDIQYYKQFLYGIKLATRYALYLRMTKQTSS